MDFDKCYLNRSRSPQNGGHDGVKLVMRQGYPRRRRPKVANYRRLAARWVTWILGKDSHGLSFSGLRNDSPANASLCAECSTRSRIASAIQNDQQVIISPRFQVDLQGVILAVDALPSGFVF
jgi:hypothetical protein